MFDYNISFNALYDLLKKRVEEKNSIEGNFLLALDDIELSESVLNQYISANGLYKKYAGLLLKRDEIELDSSVYIPYKVFIKRDQHMGYYERYRKQNWYQGIHALRNAGINAQLKRRDLLEDMTPYDHNIISRVEHISDFFSENMIRGIDMVEFDPLVGQYLLENGIGEFVSLSIIHPGLLPKAELTIINVKSNRPRIFFSTGTAPGSLSDDFGYVRKILAKRLQSMKYQKQLKEGY